MYRQYEDPYKLEKELEDWLEQHPDKSTWDEYDYENYQNLKERINFAWQDDEYESNYMRENYPDEFYSSENIDEKEPIEAGLLGNLFKGGIVDKLFNFVSKAFENIGEIGDREGKKLKFAFVHASAFDDENLTEQVNNADGDISKLPDDCTVFVQVDFVGGDALKFDVVDIYMLRKGDAESNTIKAKNITIRYSDPQDQKKCDTEFIDAIEETLKKYESKFNFGGESKGFADFIEVTSSTNLKFTLKKIVANDEMDIQLVSIDSPYEVDRTNEIINNILDEPDFVSSLPEMEPASYEVSICDDSYDVEPCDGCCVDLSECIMKVLKPLYTLYFDSMSITWNAKGVNYPTIATLADTYMWTVRGLIDQLSIEHCAKFNYAPHPAYFMQDFNYPSADESAIRVLQDDIYDLVNTIELYYCNFDGVLQKCLMDAKDMFNTELNYTLARFDA